MSMLNFSLFAIVAFSIEDLDVDITKTLNVIMIPNTCFVLLNINFFILFEDKLKVKFGRI